jgi:hypothetical protein
MLVSEFWTNTLSWLTRLFEGLGAQAWFARLQSSLSDLTHWLWGSGAPIIGGLMVLLAGVIVARAIRESAERSHRPRSDWVAERRTQDSAGRWRPTMALHNERRNLTHTEVARLKRQLLTKRA